VGGERGKKSYVGGGQKKMGLPGTDEGPGKKINGQRRVRIEERGERKEYMPISEAGYRGLNSRYKVKS